MSARGMTLQSLPFCTPVRSETDTDSRYSDMSSDNRRAHHTKIKVKRSNGKSTGRPRKIPLPVLVTVPGKGVYQVIEDWDD